MKNSENLTTLSAAFPCQFSILGYFSTPKILIMHLQYAIFGLGTSETILILAALLLLFGGKKIPELMRGLGQGVREFNAAKSNIKQEIEEGMKDKPAKKEEASSSEEKKS